MSQVERIGWLVKAQREAETAAEVLRLMIEHDVAVTCPDSGEFAALRAMVDARLESAAAFVGSACPAPDDRDVEPAIYCDLAERLARRLSGKVAP